MGEAVANSGHVLASLGRERHQQRQEHGVNGDGGKTADVVSIY